MPHAHCLEHENARLLLLLSENGSLLERAFGREADAHHAVAVLERRTEELAQANADLRRAEEQRLVLTRELEHRLKNTLALVQAIAGQTFRHDNATPEAREAFALRLVVLGRAHDILTQASWTNAPIRAVIESALAPHHTAGRFCIEGPDLQLAAQPALTLALALHELATNATKYGAREGAVGELTLCWSVAEERFRLRWSEHGGPPVQAPTRKGLGTRLIERGLGMDFEAEVCLTYASPGFDCTIDAPLSAVCEA